MDLLIILICLCAPAALLTPWNNLASATDFPNYYAAARMIASGHFATAYDVNMIGPLENQFFPDLKGRVLPFLLCPALAWCCLPLAALPYRQAFATWTVFLFASLVCAFFLFSHVFRLSRRERLWAAAILGTSGPCLETLRIGQPSTIFLLGLALLAYGLKNDRSLAAACGQSVFWLKPHILLPLIFFEAGRGLISIPTVTGLIGIGGIVVAVLLGGSGVINSYYHLLSSHQAQLYMGLSYGPTLRALLINLLPGFGSDLLVLAVYALVPIFAFLIGRIYQQRQTTLLLQLLAVVLPVSLVLSPHLHNYDLLLLFPGIVGVFAMRSSKSQVQSMRVVAGLLACLLSLPIYILGHYFYVLRGGVFNPFFIGTCIWAIVAVQCLGKLPDESR